MYRVPGAGASWGLRWGVLTLAGIVTLLTVTTEPADARGRRYRYYVKRYVQIESFSPRYAAIVLDAKTGAPLHEANPDSLRHPASLTKIMTLFLLFERLEAGKIKLTTQMEVSEEAASQSPTKLGLRPGQSIAVEDAIKGLVTKSANDASVVIAETLAGDQDAFARQMTAKARSLGMSKTVYRNASGLPNDEQVTTARDQAILGMAIQQRFPQYYRYFSTPAFVYRGHAMRNHNSLLGRVNGVDGIKTGYTRASGFNLVTSVRRADRHIVAVVLGGPSAGQRDARMRSLIEGHIMEASIRQTAPIQFAAAAPVTPPAAAMPPRPAVLAEPAKPQPAASEPAKPKLAAAISVPVRLAAPAHAPAPVTRPAGPAEATATIPAIETGTTEPIKPVKVRIVKVKLAPPRVILTGEPTLAQPLQTAEAAPAPAATRVTTTVERATVERVSAPAAAPVTTQIPTQVASAEPAATPVASTEAPAPVAPPAPRRGILGVLPATIAAASNALVPSANASEQPRPVARHGWVVQVGAYEDESEARQHLSSAQAKATRLLGRAEAYTERTIRGAKTYFRARFAGLDRGQAEAACRALKRSDMTCVAIKI